MRKLLGLILLIGLVGPATAQIDIDQHDGTTDFTSRGVTPGGSDGWAINKYAFDKNGGGINNGGITGYTSVIQDQNCTTLENWQFGVWDQLLANANGPIAPGSPDSTPDVNAPLSATAVFTSPTCSTHGAAAWIFTVTLTTPLLFQVDIFNDIFTGTFLPSNATWTADGTSSHISIANAGGSMEFPIQSQDPLVQQEIGQEYGYSMAGGPGLAIQQGTEGYPSNARIFINRLKYTHTTRAGSYDTTGTLYASNPSVGPDNYGMSGAYPDAINVGAHQPARADDLIWLGDNPNFFGTTVIGTLTLGGSLARSTFGSPLAFGNGWLEIDPLDPVFAITLAGGIPGLQVPGVLAAQQIYQPSPGIQGTIAVDLHVFQANIYAQELRIDLGTGQLEVGSLDANHFRL